MCYRVSDDAGKASRNFSEIAKCMFYKLFAAQINFQSISTRKLAFSHKVQYNVGSEESYFRKMQSIQSHMLGGEKQA